MTPRLVAQTRHPVVLQSVEVLDFDLAQIDPWLRLIEGGGIHCEEVVFGPFILIRSFGKHVNAAFVTEVPVCRVGIFRIVAFNFCL